MLPNAENIAKLTGQIEALTGEKLTLTTQLEAAQGQAKDNFTALGLEKEKVTNLGVQVTTLTGERDTARNELKVEKDGFEARAKALIEPEVTRRIAAAGTDPVRRDPNASTDGTMNRKEFAALSPAKQSEFCRKGGKLTD